MLRDTVMTAVAQIRATGDKAWYPDGPVLVTNSEDLLPWPQYPAQRQVDERQGG